MFRKGGSTNEGVMTGITDRENFAVKGIDDATMERIKAREDLFRSITAPRGGEALSNLLIRGGLNLISGTGEKGLRGVATAFQKPTEQFMQESEREDQFGRQLGLAAATGVLGEKERERIATIKAGSTMSAIARRAREAVLSAANNPATGKPFKDYKEAFTYYSMSAGDISRASIPERIDEEEKKIIAGGGSTKYAPAQAKYNIQIREKIPAVKRGGFFKSKKGSPKKPITGNYYYDLDSEQLYLFDGKQLKVVTDIESIS